MNILSRLFHRHRWALYSHTIHRGIWESDDGLHEWEEWEAGVVLRCRCGKRRHVTKDEFRSHDLAMEWVRSLVTEEIPDRMPAEERIEL